MFQLVFSSLNISNIKICVDSNVLNCSKNKLDHAFRIAYLHNFR